MILEVQHETRQEYNEPVTEWHAELRLQPCNDEHQSCHSFHLIISQPATTYAYEDGFGNRVHHFNLLNPHLQVRVLSASLVETSTRDYNLAEFAGRFPVALDSAPCEMLDFLPYRGPVCDTPLLSPLLDALAPASGDSVGEWVVRVGNYIHEHFEYARDVTDFTSPIDDLLKIGKGVCQDFAHLMIAVLRSNNVPARYVSGYIHRENKESQSHAWCEAWLPGLGWIGFDPTNGCQANDHFVRVAVGRDYTDVPPNKGIHRGQAHETIFVRVATRELPRLPSMSWQERLPPLDVPLTSIARRKAIIESDEQQLHDQ